MEVDSILSNSVSSLSWKPEQKIEPPLITTSLNKDFVREELYFKYECVMILW